MAVNPKSEDGIALRKLFPLYTMPAQQFKELCSGCSVSELTSGSFLFNLGDEPESFIYLLKGDVSLEGGEFMLETIRAGTDAAKYALAHQFPRKVSARVLSTVSYISLGLNAFEAGDINYNEQEHVYQVKSDEDSEADASVDWLAALLQSPLFRRLPAVNLQQVLMSLEEVSFSEGKVIFRQGDAGDYFFLIRKGCCSLSRKAPGQAKDVHFQNLSEGETFGEQAILTGEQRNMTATAATDIQVSRIDADRFIKYIKQAVIQYVDFNDLDQERAHVPAPLVLDVRLAEEYSKNHIQDSRNVPFFSFDMHIKELKKELGKIIIVCADGSTSDAAAFELIKLGINAYVLSRGMQSLPYKVEDPEESIQAELVSKEVVEQEKESVSDNSEVSLQQKNQLLSTENKHLKTELALFKKQYRLLYKQTEKLKAALDKLRAK